MLFLGLHLKALDTEPDRSTGQIKKVAIPVRYNWSVFARKMHATSEFAMIVLSKCERECVCV